MLYYYQNIESPGKYKNPILMKYEIQIVFPNAIRANLLHYGDVKIYL